MYTVGNIYVIAAVAVVGGGLFGFDISSMSAIISTKAYLCYFNQGPQYLDTDGQCSGPRANVQGGITAAMPGEPLFPYQKYAHWSEITGGSWLGALISGYLSDYFGRKKTIQIGSLIWYASL